MILQWSVLLQNTTPGLVSSSFTRISAFLDPANPNLPPPSSAVLCCPLLLGFLARVCSPVHALACTLIVCSIDVHVRDVLAAKVSRVKETWRLRACCSATQSPAHLVGNEWLCVGCSSYAWTRSHTHLSSSAGFSMAQVISLCSCLFMFQALVADLSCACAVPWCDSSCQRELSTPHPPTLLLFH